MRQLSKKLGGYAFRDVLACIHFGLVVSEITDMEINGRHGSSGRGNLRFNGLQPQKRKSAGKSIDEHPKKSERRN
jgi:hypothetical protein